MLLTVGLLFMLIGYRETLNVAPVVPGAWLFFVPVWTRSLAWCLTGLIAVYFAIRPKPDTYGWLGLYMMPTLTATSYAGSFLLWVVMDRVLGEVPLLPLHGDPQAWTNAILRVPVIITVLICSGWVENPRRDCA